ncbi:MAG: DUF5058 family protein [Lachnospiraceae bacterium]|nr:DUF5058 family protein [Lachnospiraceae bacterium]
MQAQLNGPVMYAICGGIIFAVALICVIFLVRAYRAGLAIGMDKKKMDLAITSSATFSLLPSVGILLGVIALSGSLGIPLPWLRLSVIGALHYETQVAEAAAEAVGLPGLSASAMTAQAFVTIALVMGVCIMWGMVFSIIFNRSYTKKLKNPSPKKTGGGLMSEFADTAMTAMFIGLVSAYIGSYIGGLVSGQGLFTFRGDWMPLVAVFFSGAAMAGFTWLVEKKKIEWLEGFSVAGSMLVGMASVVLAGLMF